MMQPVTLEGRRCRLVPLSHAHDDALASIQDPRNLQWLWRQHALRSAEDRREFTSYLLADERVLAFAVLDTRAGAGEVVGMTTFLGADPEDRAVEIGHTWLAPACQGTGINTEMKYLMLRHAFETALLPAFAPGAGRPFAPSWPEAGPAVRVQLMTDARNARSRAAIEKIGARFEGVLRRHMVVGPGVFRDTALFSVTDEDWAGVKGGLEARLAGV
ncbi:MAG: N-acetyltransferase [Phycisphaerales bacterium]|nr:MAG: N-acetyltransferase [Phycisphaerales bacterium]